MKYRKLCPNASVPVWHLLRRNISVGQLVGYVAANLVGLTIVLAAIQFYVDAASVTKDDDSFISRDYLVLSKRVQGLGSILGPKAVFNEAEVKELESQPWVVSVGRFKPSAFNVYASVSLDGKEMSTALFFESLPDSYFDIKPHGWEFSESSSVIPIIISKDYLALYNFGFAASRGMPQISEEMIRLLPLKIYISGNGGGQSFDGRIVGFSSRLNTIAVPDDFMEWANLRFADKQPTLPSRLILEVETPLSPQATRFFEEHGYETAGGKGEGSAVPYLLTVAVVVVAVIGIVISLLSFCILLLSVHLLLLKNRVTLRNIILLGYTPGSVAKYYCFMVLAANAAVLLFSVATVAVARFFWNEPLMMIGKVESTMWPSVVAGLLVMTVACWVNLFLIRRNILSVLK